MTASAGTPSRSISLRRDIATGAQVLDLTHRLPSARRAEDRSVAVRVADDTSPVESELVRFVSADGKVQVVLAVSGWQVTSGYPQDSRVAVVRQHPADPDHADCPSCSCRAITTATERVWDIDELRTLLDTMSAALTESKPETPPADGLKLTDREREIAVLVARGMTNSEIAAEIFLSVKTIEYHLGRVYANNDISNRRQLRDLIQKGLRRPANCSVRAERNRAA